MVLARTARFALATVLFASLHLACGGSSTPPPGMQPTCGPDAVCPDVPPCAGDSCLPPDGAGGGPDGRGKDTASPPGRDTTTPPGRDTTTPPDTTCRPACGERDCGPDGCGGLCGQCGAGETCDAGACVPGECGEGRPAIEGALQTDVVPVEFDKATVTVVHKQDIDEYEDGCIVLVVVDLQRGFGCSLHVEATGAISRAGGLRASAVSFAADSQCPGFPDEREGQYRNEGGLTRAEVILGVRKVPDRNAPDSCFATVLDLRLEGEMRDPEDGRTIGFEPTSITITGELRSRGDTSVHCPCVAACDGKECGDDGCGGSCGDCPGGYCDDDAQCVCVADCRNKDCGTDGCGGSCGSCGEGERCAAGRCECVPDCAGHECGDDGCGGSCGDCDTGERCGADGRCGCAPRCDGRQCGDDGCGGTCGECPAYAACGTGGQCECGELTYWGCCDGTTVVFCNEQEEIESLACTNGCGWDNDTVGYNCGGVGEDPSRRYPYDCDDIGPCERQCTGRECGPDGCGGSCGGCDPGEGCQDGECVPCERQCSGRRCGDDGCGGTCGECEPDEFCSDAGQCFTEPPIEEYGTMCVTDEDCMPPLECLQPLGDALSICTRSCTPLIGNCPEGMMCLPNLLNPPPWGICAFASSGG